jgi:hypothetical protein
VKEFACAANSFNLRHETIFWFDRDGSGFFCGVHDGAEGGLAEQNWGRLTKTPSFRMERAFRNG